MQTPLLAYMFTCKAERTKWDKDTIFTSEKLTRRRKLRKKKRKKTGPRSATTPANRSTPPVPPTRLEEVKHLMDGKAHTIVRNIDSFDEGTVGNLPFALASI